MKECSKQSQQAEVTDMDESKGILPSLAPLANPYVPFQKEGAELYAAKEGWERGTVFPGLELPYEGNTAITQQKATLLHELQAAQFAVSELGLYLDTHSDDTEAVQLFSQYVEQAEMLQQKMAHAGVALTQMEGVNENGYTWIHDPWPWDLETEA